MIVCPATIFLSAILDPLGDWRGAFGWFFSLPGQEFKNRQVKAIFEVSFEEEEVLRQTYSAAILAMLGGDPWAMTVDEDAFISHIKALGITEEYVRKGKDPDWDFAWEITPSGEVLITVWQMTETTEKQRFVSELLRRYTSPKKRGWIEQAFGEVPGFEEEPSNPPVTKIYRWSRGKLFGSGAGVLTQDQQDNLSFLLSLLGAYLEDEIPEETP